MFDLAPGILAGLAFLGSILVGLVMVPVCSFWGRRLGAVDYPRQPVGQIQTVPRVGGLAVYLSAGLVIGVTFWLLPVAPTLSPELHHKLIGFGLGGTLVLLLGLVDDMRGLRARWKLLGQVAIAVLVYFWGLNVDKVTNPFNPGSPILLGQLEMPLNILWFLLAMNAMNIIDGLDGLAGGIFLLSLVLLLAVALVSGSLGLALIVSALAGSSAAFLRYNFFTGSIYLGDGGTLFMGFCMAGFVPLFSPKAAGMAAAIIPIATMSVPITEVAVTIIRRVWKGLPLGYPDNDHAHHRMIANGHGSRWVAVIIQVMTFVCGIIALIMVSVFNRYIAYLMAALWLVLLGLFFKMGYLRRRTVWPTNYKLRSPVFLDMDRVLHRKIWELRESESREELAQRVGQLAQQLDLHSLNFRFQTKEQTLQIQWPEDGSDEIAGERLSFTLYNLGHEGQPSWELLASVNSVNYNQSWPRLVNWLRGLGNAMVQATTRLEPGWGTDKVPAEASGKTQTQHDTNVS